MHPGKVRTQKLRTGAPTLRCPPPQQLELSSPVRIQLSLSLQHQLPVPSRNSSGHVWVHCSSRGLSSSLPSPTTGKAAVVGPRPVTPPQPPPPPPPRKSIRLSTPCVWYLEFWSQHPTLMAVAFKRAVGAGGGLPTPPPPPPPTWLRPSLRPWSRGRGFTTSPKHQLNTLENKPRRRRRRRSHDSCLITHVRGEDIVYL